MCALEYDGIDTYLGCGDDSIFSFGDGVSDIPFSVMAWIYMNDATDFAILSKSINLTPDIEWIFVNIGDNLRFQLYDDATSKNIRRVSDNTMAVYEGQWTHVAATYDGGGSSNGIVLYLNGSVWASSAFSTGSYVAMSNTFVEVEIGACFRDSASQKRYADGKIAEVSIWRNRELTQAEIQTFMIKKLVGGETGLVGYWPINDAGIGTSVPIKDIAGGYNGVMNGFDDNPWRGGPPIVLGRAH